MKTAKLKNRELLGGQAIIEGVMMKGPRYVAYAVYDPKNKLITRQEKFIPWVKKYKIFGLIFVRGFVNLLDMLRIGYRALNFSAQTALPEEAAKEQSWEMPLSLLLSFVFTFIFFIFLPASVFTYLKSSINSTILLNLIEGLVRMTIFVIFILLVSLSKDMRRVFAYHGAEHMTVHAYEAGDQLTLKNIRKYSTLHPRCGTSFLLVVMVVSIIVFSFLGRPDLLERVRNKIILLPLISGISYEFIRLVARFPKWLMTIFLWPGLLLQKVTTRRPTDAMLEAALAALRLAEK